MSFDVAAEAYGAFMGRWSEPLAGLFADRLDLAPGQRVLDVGCGPGALTAVLAERIGAEHVVAVDPSESFVASIASRLPGVDVRRASAEALPLADDSVDVAAAQLVVHFMSDPGAGLREMARVTRPGGVVAACVWDNAGDTGPLSLFWHAVHTLDPGALGESQLPGSRQGDLERRFADAGLRDVQGSTLTVHRTFADLDEWWEPFTYGVGPSGEYVKAQTEDRRREIRARCAQLLPEAPFELAATAWCAIGRVRAVSSET
jgi:SAM-dependent methyltransferase